MSKTKKSLYVTINMICLAMYIKCGKTVFILFTFICVCAYLYSEEHLHFTPSHHTDFGPRLNSFNGLEEIRRSPPVVYKEPCKSWDELIPSMKLTASLLKMDGCKIHFLVGWPIFRGELLVSGRANYLSTGDQRLLQWIPKSDQKTAVPI